LLISWGFLDQGLLITRDDCIHLHEVETAWDNRTTPVGMRTAESDPLEPRYGPSPKAMLALYTGAMQLIFTWGGTVERPAHKE